MSTELTIVSPDGVRHTATLCFPQTPDAPVVLILPAMGAAAEYYRPFAERIAAQGVAIAALLDLRGQGRSSARARRGDDFGYREILELDLPWAVSELRRAFRGRRLYLAGHSLGGQLALFGAAHPGVEIDGLILLAAGTAHWRVWQGRERWKARLATAGIRTASRLLPWYPGHVLGFGGEQPRRLMRDWGRVTREDLYRPEGSDFDYESSVRELALPVLSIGVRGDPVAPDAAREALLARLPRAQVRRVEIDGVLAHRAWKRHFSWAREPADAVDSIGSWLAAR